MDFSIGLFPLNRCKILHLVRHAQGYHNAAGEKDAQACLSYDYLDASLTPLGWEQVDKLRKHVRASGLSKKTELVITSPLTRAMQTAIGVFGGDGHNDEIDVTPLMVENIGNNGRPAISSLNCPPFLAVELCREHLGTHPCDKRRSISEYKPLFPAVDLSLVETDEDTWWKEDIKETDEEVAAREMKFINWLWTREEKEIAIVSHNGFLHHTLNLVGKDCHPTVMSEFFTDFGNCELRSVVLVDRSMIGSCSTTANNLGNRS